MPIDLRDVRYAYPQAPDQPVINIPNWSVPAGEHVFLHGPSGSGKSTLLNLLSGMTGADQGSVMVLGQPLDQMNQRQRDRFRAENIGYVFQQFNLIPYLNAIENIRLASHFSRPSQTVSRQTIQTLLQQLHIQPSEWHKSTGQLSIGQQQRVAIARAIINRPQLLIADEPTSALDQSNRDNFMSLLLSLIKDQGATLLFVSHDLSLSHYFKHIVPLSEINQPCLSVWP